MAIAPIRPIDYTASLPKAGTFTEGLQTGAAIRQLQEKRDADEALRNQKKQYALDLESAFEDPTPQRMAKLTAKYPGQREAFKQSFEMLTEPQKKNEILQAGQVYSALTSGNIDVARNIVTELIEANENAGKDASKLKSISNYIDKDPKGAAGYTGLVLSSIMNPDEFAKTFETLGKERREEKLAPIKLKKETEELKKTAADIGLSKARTAKVLIENKKLSTESKKAILELEQMKETGGRDPEKMFDQEEKLRKEYTSRTKNFITAKDAFNKLNSSALDATGAGDTALVFSFMKMLDPGSVVRESEFALAQDTAGLMAKLRNTAEKIETGQFLTSSQRKDFVRLAKKYMDAGNKQEKVVRDSLGKVVENYKLNPENVFSVEQEEEEPFTTGEVEVVKTPETQQQEKIITVDF